ncbi:branched-chain amino acid transport system II carrier protein [Microbacteriaceae bacterium 4G12]
MKTLAKKEIVFVSFMLFSMFFGAGNLIFPPFLGQEAGAKVWMALAGFIFSATGLPILGVIAIAKAGSFQTLAQRVHPTFAIIFPFLIYVSIGPGLGIPRAGSLAFEMGPGQFLPEAWSQQTALFIYTLIFFGIVFWLSLSPSKLVDRFGKLLTPLLLVLILAIFVKSLITPVGSFGTAHGNYNLSPVFQGFLDGYLTMDALASLIFGIVIANALRAKGIEHEKSLSRYMMMAGVGAGILLSIIYVILAYLGAASVSLGKAENGAQVLTKVMTYLFGQSGTVLLGVIFTVACLCVSIGLVTSCSQFFAKVFPKVSYKIFAFLLCVVSMAIANLGLTQILKVSVPILGAIYPVALVLIVLALLHDYMKGYSSVYVATVLLVGLFSLVDMINQTFLSQAWSGVLSYFPLYREGVGWVVPALVGLVIGYIYGEVVLRRKDNEESKLSA